MVKKRPTGVTVIAWIIIIMNGLSLVVTPIAFTMPEGKRVLEQAGLSLATAIFWMVVSGGICMVSGIAMLKGLNWGRLLYLYFAPISIILGWVLYGFRPNIVSVIIYMVILVFLTRPAASTFFASGNSQTSKLAK